MSLNEDGNAVAGASIKTCFCFRKDGEYGAMQKNYR